MAKAAVAEKAEEQETDSSYTSLRGSAGLDANSKYSVSDPGTILMRNGPVEPVIKCISWASLLERGIWRILREISGGGSDPTPPERAIPSMPLPGFSFALRTPRPSAIRD
jgi:hypothetical protein